MKPHIISIDGKCGSGKSTLSALLKDKIDCNVVHMDDFYLPFSERHPDWEMIPGGNMDMLRIRESILKPAILGEEIVYQKYFCREDRLFDPVVVAPKPFLVVEGSYSQHPTLTEFYDKKIFLTCSEETQRIRLIDREGDRFRFYEQRWIPMEERYYKAYAIREHADHVVETKDFTVYDQLMEHILAFI